MTPDTVVTIMTETLEVIIALVAVSLLPALVVGLLVSVFQAATQINEMTLSFIPKLIVTMLTLVVAGPWMLQLIITYTNRMVENIPFVIG
jgi:flagellar biosynthetic protein FliQ